MELTRREFVKDSLAYLLSAANRASGGYRSALGFMAEPVGVCRNRMEADHRNHCAEVGEVGELVGGSLDATIPTGGILLGEFVGDRMENVSPVHKKPTKNIRI